MGGVYYTEYRTVPYRILFRPYKILNFLEFFNFYKKGHANYEPIFILFLQGFLLK